MLLNMSKELALSRPEGEQRFLEQLKNAESER